MKTIILYDSILLHELKGKFTNQDVALKAEAENDEEYSEQLNYEWNEIVGRSLQRNHVLRLLKVTHRDIEFSNIVSRVDELFVRFLEKALFFTRCSECMIRRIQNIAPKTPDGNTSPNIIQIPAEFSPDLTTEKHEQAGCS